MISSFSMKSKGSLWAIMTCILGFWLSSSLLLDAVIMPSLYLSGMLMEPLFANSGYLLFSIFNRVELLCAALIVTAFLLMHKQSHLGELRTQPIIGALILLVITFITTYGLTPAMSAMAVDLDLFNAFNVPSGLDMRVLHVSYIGLEIAKLGVGLGLFRFCFQRLVA